MQVTPCLILVLSLSSPFLNAMFRPARPAGADGAPAGSPRGVRSSLATTGARLLSGDSGRMEERKAAASAAPARASAGAGQLTAEQRRQRHHPVRLAPVSGLPARDRSARQRPSNIPGWRASEGGASGRVAALPALAQSKDFDEAPPTRPASAAPAPSPGPGADGPASPATASGGTAARPRIDLGVQTAGGLQAWVVRPARTTRVGSARQRFHLAQITVFNSSNSESLCLCLPKAAGSAAPYAQVCPSAPGMADLELHWELEPSYQLLPGEEIQVKLDAGGESAAFDITLADGTPHGVLELTFF